MIAWRFWGMCWKNETKGLTRRFTIRTCWRICSIKWLAFAICYGHTMWTLRDLMISCGSVNWNWPTWMMKIIISTNHLTNSFVREWAELKSDAPFFLDCSTPLLHLVCLENRIHDWFLEVTFQLVSVMCFCCTRDCCQSNQIKTKVVLTLNSIPGLEHDGTLLSQIV